MATERTAMTPDGDVIHFEVADEQYMTPEGAVIDAGLDGSSTPKGPLGHPLNGPFGGPIG